MAGLKADHTRKLPAESVLLSQAQTIFYDLNAKMFT